MPRISSVPSAAGSIRDAPIKNHMTVPIQKSIRFFIIILPEFFALVKPASTIAKPACIQNTNAAPIRNQTPNICSLTKLNISSIMVASSIKKHFINFENLIFSSPCDSPAEPYDIFTVI